jgi:hypothetical protein
MATIFHVLVTSPLAHDECRLAPNLAARPPQTRGLYACIRCPFPSEAKLTSLCRRREKEKKGIVWLLSSTSETKRMTEMVTAKQGEGNQPINRMWQSQRKRHQVSRGKMQSRDAGRVHPNAYKYSSTPARLEIPNTSIANEQSEAPKQSLIREQSLFHSSQLTTRIS